MPKKVDTRDFTFARTNNNFAAARAVSRDLPGNRKVNVERVNPFTGSTKTLGSRADERRLL